MHGFTLKQLLKLKPDIKLLGTYKLGGCASDIHTISHNTARVNFDSGLALFDLEFIRHASHKHALIEFLSMFHCKFIADRSRVWITYPFPYLMPFVLNRSKQNVERYLSAVFKSVVHVQDRYQQLECMSYTLGQSKLGDLAGLAGKGTVCLGLQVDIDTTNMTTYEHITDNNLELQALVQILQLQMNVNVYCTAGHIMKLGHNLNACSVLGKQAQLQKSLIFNRA